MGDRYTILGSIAKGGMAEVYLGRMMASAGFSRPVAIKRLHDTLRSDPEFVAMLVDEARLTARIRHTNVVDILDVVVKDNTFALVLEWVEGASLSVLAKNAVKEREPIPLPIVAALMVGILRGLAAAHEARDEDGQPLGIVHRDVSPQNVLVGVDGVPRIIDFGVAKAYGKLEATRPGEIRGKYAYMAPEQLTGRPVTAQVDVYAAGVVMWELVTGLRLFKSEDERATIAAVLQGDVPLPSSLVPGVPSAIDAIITRAVAREPSARFLDAREMLAALEPLPRASEEEVGAWVRAGAGDVIEKHQRMLAATSAPISARSLDAVLAELGPSRPQSSGSLPSYEESASFRLPPPVTAPPPVSTDAAQPARRSPGLVALAAGAAVLTAAIVLGVFARASPPARPAQADPPPAIEPATATITAVAVAPPAASSAALVVTAPSAVASVVASAPTSTPSPPGPRTRAKVKPRPATTSADPTDHR